MRIEVFDDGDTVGTSQGDSHLHEGGQVGVVVVQGGDDVELNLDQDAFAQVILISDAGQSVKELDLSSSERHMNKYSFCIVYACLYS